MADAQDNRSRLAGPHLVGLGVLVVLLSCAWAGAFGATASASQGEEEGPICLQDISLPCPGEEEGPICLQDISLPCPGEEEGPICLQDISLPCPGEEEVCEAPRLECENSPPPVPSPVGPGDVFPAAAGTGFVSPSTQSAVNRRCRKGKARAGKRCARRVVALASMRRVS